MIGKEQEGMNVSGCFGRIRGASTLRDVCFPAFLAAAALTAPVQAQLCSWTAGTSSWFTGSNWSCGHAPTTSDSVVIGNGGTCQVVSGAATAQASLVQIYGQSTLAVLQ